ncbi:MAG: lysophospholipid acyltransferase family protein [Xenococcaceae cyanobacterium MO_207.B15]|nr:lysophospholipid acyltransferase family protein [Xenococcaceae cyanobacterium MO_207.B15]
MMNNPRLIAQSLLSMMTVRVATCYENRIPQDVPVVVISNHRSFLDAIILIQTLPYPLRIACHHYMGQTPGIRNMVELLGCFPLAQPKQRKRQFFEQASKFLTSRQWVGLFPEGTQPMVEPTKPLDVGKFHRGFAHLALQVRVPNLVILPVAIASLSETIYQTIPIHWLSSLDASEPFFHRSGLHPMVVYHRTCVLFGHPYWISTQQQQEYQGKQAKQLATQITEYCREQIIELLAQGCY